MPKKTNAEFVLGFLVATALWAGILGWQAAYAPTEQEKNDCNEAAKQAGHKTDECKSLWERTTTDPVAFFTLVLAFSTIGLWTATIALYFAGEKSIKETRRIGEAQVRAYVYIKAAAIEFRSPPIIVPVVRFIVANTGQSPARNFLWNVTLQYIGGSVSRETIFVENWWLQRIGMDIPATSEEHSEGAWVPMPLNQDAERVAAEGKGLIVRAKIDFRFTDVFDRDWFGDAYFAGVIGKRILNQAEIEHGISEWSAKLSAMPKPRGWEDVGKTKEK